MFYTSMFVLCGVICAFVSRVVSRMTIDIDSFVLAVAQLKVDHRSLVLLGRGKCAMEVWIKDMSKYG